MWSSSEYWCNANIHSHRHNQDISKTKRWWRDFKVKQRNKLFGPNKPQMDPKRGENLIRFSNEEYDCFNSLESYSFQIFFDLLNSKSYLKQFIIEKWRFIGILSNEIEIEMEFKYEKLTEISFVWVRQSEWCCWEKLSLSFVVIGLNRLS